MVAWLSIERSGVRVTDDVAAPASLPALATAPAVCSASAVVAAAVWPSAAVFSGSALRAAVGWLVSSA